MDPIATRKTRLQECHQGIDVGVFGSGWKTSQKAVAHGCYIFPQLLVSAK